jgi:hypothetical protein
MKALKRSFALAGAACLLSALPAAAEELTIVSKVTRNNEAPVNATSYIGNTHVRMSEGEGGQDFMIDLQSGNMTVMDGRKKEYFVITPDDIKAVGAKMQEQMKAAEPQMKQAQEQMKNMPPQAREAMEKMMGGFAAAVTVEKGASKTVAGYSCDVWTLSIGSMSKTEECLTTALPFPAQAWDRYREMAQSMRSAMASMGPMGKAMGDLQEKTKDMKGIPLSRSTTVSVMGKSNSTVSEVTEVRKGAIPDSAWQIPTGYKQVEAPFKKMLSKS